MVQIRDRETPARQLLPDLLRCVEYARKYGVTVILNDRCDLVLAARADGVHLGQDDLPPPAARRVLGRNAIIGHSTHDLRQVVMAGRLPVQYIGFGPVYPTSSKARPSPVTGLTGLRRACGVSKHPVVAIGGITDRRLREVLDAGAVSAAVIAALMATGGIARSMDRLLRIASR